MSGDDKQSDNHDVDFRELMADVTPLEQDKIAKPQGKRRPKPLHLQVEESEEELADLSIETGEVLEFQRPGVQNRVFHDLKRGYIEAEATLDLHGMRVVEARQAMSRFLQQSGRKGRRCVLIIHGKGQGSRDQQPVLKQKTNQWLRQRDEVLAFCSAPRWNGGTGATYVLLSRKYEY
ncbi:MAG: Smr/MutS family protein [Chromatiales bacterium]|jgi:DNA-nicking Smr family endonuclease